MSKEFRRNNNSTRKRKNFSENPFINEAKNKIFTKFSSKHFWKRIWASLETPLFYRILRKLTDGKLPQIFARKHVRAKKGDKVLDFGCGPGDILNDLPQVEYLGYDINPAYIQDARKRFKNRGKFYTKRVEDIKTVPNGPYDIVLAKGLIHHLPDRQALHLLKIARQALAAGGRLITLDGVLIKRQSLWSRYFVLHDRGRYVRTLEAYRALFKKEFPSPKCFVYENLLRFPYTLLIVEASTQKK